MRERVRGLDLNVCVLCRSRGRVETGRLGVHHIVPLEEGYDLRNEPENLVTLCPSCHEEAERGGVSRERLRELIGAYREQSPPG